MADPSFYSIPTASITPPPQQDERLLLRQARTQASDVATKFTLASGIISFATSDILDIGSGTLRYYFNVYSKIIQYPGYLPQILAAYHPSGLTSYQAFPVPFLDVVASTATIKTLINPQIEAADSINPSSGLRVHVYGYSSSSVFGAQTPGPTAVFSYYILDGAAEGLVSKV